MAEVIFRAMVRDVLDADDKLLYRDIKVPKLLKRAHCNIAEMRSHPKLGAWANADAPLFNGMLARVLRDDAKVKVGEYIRLDQLPDSVKVDTSGYLATVTITI